MYLVIILFFLAMRTSECEKNMLLKFKSDVDKVGKDFENLVFDIVKKIVSDISENQVNSDYYTSDEDTSIPKTTTQHSVTKKILENILENTTETSYAQSSEVKNSFPRVELLENRLKRSADMNTSDTKRVGDKLNQNGTEFCPKKSQEDRSLELQHIVGLQEEIKKLHDLVLLLRDQQKVISLLDKGTHNVDGDLTSRFDAKDLLKILDYVNNRDIQDRKQKSSTSDKRREEISTPEELANLRNELRDVIETLNKTKDILTLEKVKELSLEKELDDQKLDITFMKMMMRQLYKKNLNSAKENTGDDLLGTPIHLPKSLPEHTTKQPKDDVIKMIENRQPSNETLKLENRAKSSEMDDLERLLHKLKRPAKSDIESKMLDLEEVVNKKKKEESMLKQLKSIERSLERQKERQSTNTDSELMRKLQIALKTMDGRESRNLNEDVELELQKLQGEIDNLRPKEELDLSDEDLDNEEPKNGMKQFQAAFKKMFDRQNKKEDSDDEQFQTFLNALLDQEGKREEGSTKQFETILDRIVNQGTDDEVRVTPGRRGTAFLLREVVNLRRQLASMKKSKIRGTNTPNSGYNYRPGMSGPFAKRPGEIKLPSEGYQNSYYPQYPPYTNPSYQNMNQFYKEKIQTGPNNKYFTSYDSTSNYVPWKSKFDFVPPYSYPIRLNQNTYRISTDQRPFPGEYNYNIEGNLENNAGQVFEEPKGPNRFNVDVPQFDQGSYQRPNDYFSVPSYTEKADSRSLEYHQVPSTGPAQTGQHNFAADTYQKTFPNPSMSYTQTYINGQNFARQEDRNQFFHDQQQSVYSKPFPEPLHRPELPSGSGPIQPEAYPPKTPGNAEYAYHRVEDLKTQIFSLQNIIDGLNKPNYTQTPQDKETVVNLERQINELKSIINSLNPDLTPPNYVPSPPNADQNIRPPKDQSSYPTKSKKRRSVENNEDSRLYDQVASGLKQLIFEKENNGMEGRNTYDDVQKRINDLKYQLETETTSKGEPERLSSSAFLHQPPYYQHSHFTHTPPKTVDFELFKAKKNDLFTSIVIKIVDKILGAIPAVLERLFGHGLTELSNFGGYGDNYNVYYGGQNDIQKLFKSLGFFGYGPMILLKILDGFTTFVNILKKNNFFKTFLMPALILLIVAGAVVFLIWWLQPSAEYYDPNSSRPQSGGYYGTYKGPYSNYNYHGNGYVNNRNNYYDNGGSYGPPVYFGSYLDGGRQ